MKTVELKAPPDIDLKEVDRRIYKSLTTLTDLAEMYFRQSYYTWEEEHQPKFQTQSKIENGDWVVYYFTEDTPYVWVDNGTDGPYKIRPKNSSFLHFKVGGSPKTQPGKMMATQGRPGTEWRTALEVEHPGITPRDFSGQIAEKLNVLAPAYFERYMEKGRL